MKPILQIILDANILIAAFRSQRVAANLLLDKLNDSRWRFNVSAALLLEYENHSEDIRLSTLRKYAEALGKEIRLEIA